MDNIFDTIVNSMPAPKKKAPEVQKEEPLKNLVAKWQKNETAEDTALQLKRLKPTISSAMTSYAPGMDKELSIKAATLTLDALRKYNPEAGADPTTYVFHNLKRLNRLGTQRSNIIQLPESMMNDKRILNEAAAKFQEEYGREASLEEQANISGFNTRKVDRLQNTGAIVNDTSMLSEDSRQSMYTTKDLTDEDYFEYVYASVNPVDQKIMEWTSGLHGKPTLSNNDIAKRIHMSPAAVSQHKQKIQSLMSDVRGLL